MIELIKIGEFLATVDMFINELCSRYANYGKTIIN